jgi:hypothetical protein
LDKIRKIVRNVLFEAKEKLSKKYGNAVSYSAVMIEDPAEIQKIFELAQQYIPDQGWISSNNYHMTIGSGVLPDSLRLRGDLNSPVELTINVVGISENSIAFGVIGYYSKNEMPHITIAFKEGSRPEESNNIQSWKPIDKVIVNGIVREIGQDNKVLKEYVPIDTGLNYGKFNGIPNKFPQPEDFDQFGNKIE